MNELDKSLESWIWDAACSIRGAKDAAKYKEFILPLIFTKPLCDVCDGPERSRPIESGQFASSRSALFDLQFFPLPDSTPCPRRKASDRGKKNSPRRAGPDAITINGNGLVRLVEALDVGALELIVAESKPHG